jgi:hypothetical protein
LEGTELGHNTTAYVANYFISNSTATYLKELLEINNRDYLAQVAMFADRYKYTHAGAFTREWHYIDAHDNPRQKCNVDYARDCKKGGCLISALANYTERAMNPDLDEEEQQLAIKLLVHLIGDLHQPLHNEDVAQGGTQIRVRWQSNPRKLHVVWDSDIPEKVTQRLDRSSNHLASWWANELVNEITHGRFAAEREKWLMDFDLANPNGTAMAWSREANKLVCSHVFPPNYGPTEIVDKELSQEYYSDAGPIVEQQVARAGLRMAAWLNGIADELRVRKGSNPVANEL